MLSERQREHAARMLRHLERLSNADVVELAALLPPDREPPPREELRRMLALSERATR